MMTSRAVRPLDRDQIISQVNYLMSLEDAELIGVAPGTSLHASFLKAFKYNADKGRCTFVAYWPDGVYGFVVPQEVGNSFLPAYCIPPELLEAVYLERFCFMNGVALEVLQ